MAGLMMVVNRVVVMATAGVGANGLFAALCIK